MNSRERVIATLSHQQPDLRLSSANRTAEKVLSLWRLLFENRIRGRCCRAKVLVHLKRYQSIRAGDEGSETMIDIPRVEYTV